MDKLFEQIPNMINSLLDTSIQHQLTFSQVINNVKEHLSKQSNITTQYELYKRKNNLISFYDNVNNINGVILIHLDTHYTPATPPKTQYAGELFNDLCYLHNIPSEEVQLKYILYITDSMMWNYFINKANGFQHVFNQSNEMNTTLDPQFFSSKPNTFIKSLSNYNNDTICLTTKLANSLSFNYKLRLIEITSDTKNISTQTSVNEPLLQTKQQFELNELNELISDCVNMVSKLGTDLTPSDVKIINRGVPHTPESLPTHTMGIYMFYYKDHFLKIGKAGPNSNVRFKNNHYHPASSNSNLAKSILIDEGFRDNVDEHTVGQWIKDNTQRIDIIIDQKFGMFVLNFIEAALHLKYKPKYEGFNTQLK